MKIRHILLPTDLSADALRPCKPVATLAKESGARITLMHVVQDLRLPAHGAPLAPPISAPDLGADVERAREALEEHRKKLPADVDVTCELLTAENVVGTVTRWADENKVDLIALSTHGRTGFRHLALGSVAESILRHSNVPVLVFPRTEE